VAVLAAAGAPAETWAPAPLALVGTGALVALIGLVGLVAVGAEAGEALLGACRLGAGERLAPAALARAGCAVLAVMLVGLAVGLVGPTATGCTGLVGAGLAAGVVARPLAGVVAVEDGLVGPGAADGAAVTGAVVTGEIPADAESEAVVPADPAVFDPAGAVLAMPLAGGEAIGVVAPGAEGVALADAAGLAGTLACAVGVVALAVGVVLPAELGAGIADGAGVAPAGVACVPTFVPGLAVLAEPVWAAGATGPLAAGLGAAAALGVTVVLCGAAPAVTGCVLPVAELVALTGFGAALAGAGATVSLLAGPVDEAVA
jgi:hypothetical protein